MYIHRIVIDANCINARGGIYAMNALEAYHNAGIVEILITTTIDAEFVTAPLLQKEKSKKYKRIGGAGLAQMGNDGIFDSKLGATPDNSRFWPYYLEIFGKENLKNTQYQNARRKALRDCLHLDQAILNNANYFVTTDRILVEKSKGIKAIFEEINVVYPEDCLSSLQAYFRANYGTSNPDDLAKIINSSGPIILGSNTFNCLAVSDPLSGDVLLSCWIRDRRLIIECQIRDSQGKLILEIKEGVKPKFHSHGADIRAMGRGSLVIGEESWNQVYIGNETSAYLAVSALSSGRALFDRVNLHAADGQRKLVVKREMMKNQGLVLGPPRNAL